MRRSMFCSSPRPLVLGITTRKCCLDATLLIGACALGVLTAATAHAQHQLPVYSQVCLDAPGAVRLDAYGTLTFGARADSLQRVANTAAINAAIAAAPRGGAVCLPADSLFLGFDTAPRHNLAHIRLYRDSITLWGAGTCGWGNLAGCTYLGTTGDGYYGDVDGDGDNELIRGNGLSILARPAQGDSLRDITLRGFELDGHSGWTGCYSINYEHDLPIARDCWDLLHKGIMAGDGNRHANLLIEDLKVHHYKGELIYTGGFSHGRITARRLWTYGSNASAFNVASGRHVTVEQSRFGFEGGDTLNGGREGYVRFWAELLAQNNMSEMDFRFRENRFEACHTANGCIALAVQDPGRSDEVQGVTYAFRDNTFANTADRNVYKGFYVNGRAPYTLQLDENRFEGRGIALFLSSSWGDQNAYLEAHDNYFDGVTKALAFQGSRMRGHFSGNTSVAAPGTSEVYSSSANSDVSGLVVEDNTFIGHKSPWQGHKVHAYPLTRDNELVDHGYRRINLTTDGGLINAGFEIHQVGVFDTAVATGALGRIVADGQELRLINAGRYAYTLPADHPHHDFASDVAHAVGDTLALRYTGAPQEGQWSLIAPDTTGGTSSTFEASRAEGLYVSRLAPNPATDVTSLTLESPDATAVEVALVDALGRSVRTVFAGTVSGQHRLEVDLAGLSAGTYVLRVNAARGSTNRMLLVRR